MTSFDALKERYEAGRISVAMLRIYVKKGVITQAQFEEIING